MKKMFFVVIISLLAVSCVTTDKMYSLSTSEISYSLYTQQGFFFSESNSVSFEYEPIGSVYSMSRAGYVPQGKSTVKKTTKTNLDDIYENNRSENGLSFTSGKYKSANIPDALDAMYQNAKRLGADGVINLKYEFSYVPSERVVVSGMAIKKK